MKKMLKSSLAMLLMMGSLISVSTTGIAEAEVTDTQDSSVVQRIETSEEMIADEKTSENIISDVYEESLIYSSKEIIRKPIIPKEQSMTWWHANGAQIFPDDEVGQYEDTELKYDFSLPDGPIKNGDTMSFKYPESLEIYGDSPFPLKNSDGETIGECSVNPDTHEITVKFNDYYETHEEENRHGKLSVKVRWDKTVKPGDPIEIEGLGGSVIVGEPGIGEGVILDKSGVVKSKDVIEWSVKVNQKEQVIKNPVYTDILGEFQELKPETISGAYGYYDENNQFKQVVTIPWEDFEVIGNNTGFRVELENLPLTSGEKELFVVEINYHTKSTDDGAANKYENTGKLTGDGIDETVNSEAQNIEGEGSIEGEKGVGTVQILKYDTDDKTKMLAGAEFDLIDSDGKVVSHIVTDADGKGSVKNIPYGDYTVVETKAPDGYELDATPHKVTVVKDDKGLVTISIPNKKTVPTVPTDPTDPTDPTEPTEPTEPTDPTDPTEPTDPSQPTLPQTGEKAAVWLTVVGALLIVGIVVIKFKK